MMPSPGIAWPSCSDSSNSCVISESVSDACFVSSDCVSWLSACLVVVSRRRDIMYQIIETEWIKAFYVRLSINLLRSWAVFSIAVAVGFTDFRFLWYPWFYFPLLTWCSQSTLQRVWALHLSTLTHCCHIEPCICGISSCFPGRVIVIGYNSLDLPFSADFGVSLPSDFSSLLGPKIVTDFPFVKLLLIMGLESWPLSSL